MSKLVSLLSTYYLLLKPLQLQSEIICINSTEEQSSTGLLDIQRLGSALDDECGDGAAAAFEATAINSEAAGADRNTLTRPCYTGEYTGII